MTKSTLKIVSLNIEADRHLEAVANFIHVQKPDVVMLQEVLDKNIGYFEKSIGMKGIYAPQNVIYDDTEEYTLGLLTLTNLSVSNSYSAYYKGSADKLPRLHIGETPEGSARVLLVTEVTKENRHYRLLNTHFTWTPNGKPNEQQCQDLEILLKILEKIPEFVFCGDFNAPRGTAIFDAIAKRYKDNIPIEITTTIDKNLHKAGDLNYVVDGLFTTSRYLANVVKIHNGVSDHCGVTAEIKINDQMSIHQITHE